MAGTSLKSIVAAHSLRIAQGAASMPVVAVRAVTMQSAPTGGTEEPLFLTTGAVVYPIFVLGVHDPDDAVARWAL